MNRMNDQLPARHFFQHPELNGESFFWPAGTTGVLLLHGFTATTVEVRPLAGRFHKENLTVSAPLLPGHGSSPDDLNKKSWTDWVTAAEQSLELLSAHCRELIVAGESMGALLALHLAARNPSIRGVLVYAPAIQIPKIWLSLVAAPFVPIRQKTYTSGKDPACYPWQGYTVIPVRAVSQLYRLQRHVRRLLSEVKQPIRIFQGLRDRTIDPRGAQWIYDRVGTTDKEITWLPESEHCVILDRDFDQIADLSLGLINQVTHDR